MADDTEEVVEDTPFSQILGKQVEDNAKTEAEPEAKPDEKEEPSGEDAKKEAVEDKEPDTESDEKQLESIQDELKGIKKALKAERDKNRQLATEQETPEKTSWDEDPDKALEERLLEQQQNAENRFYLLCENLVKAEHEDFDTVVGDFMEEAESDQALAATVFQAMSAEANPAQYLYNFAKNRSETKAFGGDPSKYKESIEQPLSAKIKELEKQNKELTEQLKGLGKVSKSLNDEPSDTKEAIDDADANEPTPFDDIVKQRHDMRKKSA